MNGIVKWLFRCCSVYFMICVLGCSAGPSNPETARVVNIADGDTFTLLYPSNRNVKVRLYGIDAPERAQDYGTAARKALGTLLQGHLVTLDEKDRDRYGRTVAMAYRDDGLCLNEEMLRLGYAWHYTQYDKNENWKKLAAAAKREKRGLWAKANPTPPWEWRKMKRKPKTAPAT